MEKENTRTEMKNVSSGVKKNAAPPEKSNKDRILSLLDNLGDFLKKNILTVLLILGLIFVVFGAYTAIKKQTSDASQLRALMETQREENLQSLTELQTSFQEERALREQTQREFEQRIQELDDRLALELGRIQASSTRRQRELVADPSSLPQAIEDTFGIPSASLSSPAGARKQ